MKTIIEKRNPRLIKITDSHWEKLGRLAIDRGITKQRNRSDMIALLVEEALEPPAPGGPDWCPDCGHPRGTFTCKTCENKNKTWTEIARQEQTDVG